MKRIMGVPGSPWRPLGPLGTGWAPLVTPPGPPGPPTDLKNSHSSTHLQRQKLLIAVSESFVATHSPGVFCPVYYENRATFGPLAPRLRTAFTSALAPVPRIYIYMYRYTCIHTCSYTYTYRYTYYIYASLIYCKLQPSMNLYIHKVSQQDPNWKFAGRRLINLGLDFLIWLWQV